MLPSSIKKLVQLFCVVAPLVAVTCSELPESDPEEPQKNVTGRSHKVHSHLRFIRPELFAKLKSPIMGCVPIFRDFVD